MTTHVEPLIRRNTFASEGEAIQELAREYVLCQVTASQEQVQQFEHKYELNDVWEGK